MTRQTKTKRLVQDFLTIIERERVRCDWSYAELGRRMGISRVRASALFRNSSNMTFATAVALAHPFKLELKMVGGKPSPTARA